MAKKKVTPPETEANPEQSPPEQETATQTQSEAEPQNAAQAENAQVQSEAAQSEPAADAEPSELEKAKALAEDYKRKWYAVSAEYDNYRKRMQTAVSKAYSDGASETLLKILPVADNFGYAYASADEKTRQGIDKIIKNFNAIIQSFGAEEITINVGDEFSEEIAEAVLSFPCEEGEKPHTVKQILKKGYKLGGKVIRFAQVAVTV